ncbi:hypothetical protein [Niabella hibiscisoli]|uniref:hypothetical protein n=1 Tax=Niabella hibiscisoli TaxID=1825928 RepID=UPI001F0E9383|nr:hypothetical protein [Niabella hibiscisoli]MCH5718581.1 hypothetical protein [Niabella hibiscisoli]
MHFEKHDLNIDLYTWSNADALYEGLPSRRSFDKSNGAQVLFLVNHYAAFNEQLNLRQLHLLEQLLHCELPLEARSEISVFKWMMQQLLNEKSCYRINCYIPGFIMRLSTYTLHL